MNITHFEINSEDKALLEQYNSNKEHNIEYIKENLTPETANKARTADVVTMFVNSVVDKNIIDALPNIKLLVTRSTGYDHIDVAYAESKGITICNVPAYGSRTVAEFTFALLLGLSRKIFLAVEQIKHSNNWDISHFEGMSLQGKTLGIVGTGRIGLNVMQIAKGFDMHIIAHDAFPSEQKAQDYGFTYTSLNELLNQSDVVSFHVPGGKDTHHLVNSENINQFKEHALLINTSRGDVIDPQAVLIGLNSRKIAGAALDVIEGENDLKEEAELMSGNKLNFDNLKTLLNDHTLINHPNVIVTPHIAFNTAEARQEIIKTALENISCFLKSQPNNKVTISHE